jgi:hypothetical protein
MITSWKQLVYAIHQMRQLQKNPGTANSLTLGFRLKRAEAEVDACVEDKVREWNARSQPPLFPPGQTHSPED